MLKLIVVAIVTVAAAVAVAVWAQRVTRSAPSGWSRQEELHALIGLVLVAPGAVVLGIVNGPLAGVGAVCLWGAVALVVYGAARLDGREAGDLDVENRWLIDVTAALFAALTVFFGLVWLGYVFIPAAAFLLMAARFAHLVRAAQPLESAPADAGPLPIQPPS